MDKCPIAIKTKGKNIKIFTVIQNFIINLILGIILILKINNILTITSFGCSKGILNRNTHRIFSSEITLKINGTGTQRVVNNEYYEGGYPTKIFINDVEVTKINSHSVNVGNPDDIIKLYWSSTPTNCEYMFQSLSDITEIDLSKFESSNVNNINSMFSGCKSLLRINLANFNPGRITSMQSLFYRCIKLTSLDLTSFDTSRILDMEKIFYGCNSLKHLNISNFVTSRVTKMDYMFYECKSLTSLNLSHFDTSSVTDMHNMFSDCLFTSLDLSNFVTSRVTNMEYMFYRSSKLAYVNLSKAVENSNLKLFRTLDGVQENIVFCIDISKTTKITEIINEKGCANIDCSENWIENQKKIFADNETCMGSNDNNCPDNYFEYENKCYSQKPEEMQENTNKYEKTNIPENTYKTDIITTNI